MAPDHPLAKLSAVPWAELARFDLVAAGRDHEHSVRPRLPLGSAAAAVAPSQIVENLSTALGLAAAGVALTFSPDYVGTLAAGLGVVARPLVEPGVSRTLCLYRRQAEHRDHGLTLFCAHLERLVGGGEADGTGVGADRQAAEALRV
jgi:DNA-binding transcriptional LysR family regulator